MQFAFNNCQLETSPIIFGGVKNKFPQGSPPDPHFVYEGMATRD